MNDQLKGHLQMILATVIVAASFIAMADVSQQMHPISLNLMRLSLAALAMSCLVVFDSEDRQALYRLLPRSLVIGFFYCGYFYCSFEALLTTSTINIGSLYTLTPFITAVLCIFIFKHKLTSKGVLVYILGIVGTLWVVFGGDVNRFLSLTLNRGDLVYTLGVLCMSGYMITMKLLYRGDKITVMTLGNLIGGSFWMLLAALFNEIPLNWQDFDCQYYPSMAYLAFGATLFTGYLFQKASTLLKPVNISAYIYLNPAFVTIFSMVLLKESVDAIVWVGVFLSTLATFILQYMTWKPQAR